MKEVLYSELRSSNPMNIQPTLIKSCIDGERKAEYELYKITFSYLMSICMRYTGNEDKSKELLNIGFFKVLSNLKKYEPNYPFKPWLRKVMINTLINEYKKEKTHHNAILYVEDYHETDKFAELNSAVSKIDAELIYKFIAKLPPASQQVFNLYFIDGFKHKEIAEMLNITEGTSKWHLNAAREKLKSMLKDIDTPISIFYNE